MFRREVAPNLILRQFEDRDADALYAAADRDRAYLREWLPWVDRTQSVLDIREFIGRARGQWENNRSPQSGIWIDDELVGCVGCHEIDYVNRNCSIGYWLASTRQGQGIITRSCAMLLDYLFNELSLHRVEIRCATGNFRSCAIPPRLGFGREGVLREAEWVNDRWVDLVVWGITVSEWSARAR